MLVKRHVGETVSWRYVEPKRAKIEMPMVSLRVYLSHFMSQSIILCQFGAKYQTQIMKNRSN